MENENQLPLPGENPQAENDKAAPSPDSSPPTPEPIVLSKLFPDVKQDLDALFPDPQMKQLLKEVHRTRQSNQRFLKRMNLTRFENDGDDPESDS